MKRVGTRGIRPLWRRGEHATTGADQTLGPRPVTLSLEGRPLLAVSGSPWGPAKVSSHVPWIVGSRLPLRRYREPGPVRASVHLSRVLVEAGVTPRTHPRTCSVSKATSQSVTARLARKRTGCNRGCGTCVVGGSLHWGPPCSDDPVSSSVVTGALVARREVT